MSLVILIDLQNVRSSPGYFLHLNAWGANLSGAIGGFVSVGRELFQLLRSEGRTASELDLHILYTQLYVLQLETIFLKRAMTKETHPSVPLWDAGADQFSAELTPTITSMAAYLKIGDRLRATIDHYPARIGSIGRILYFKGMPGNWYVVVVWESPEKNVSTERTSRLLPLDLRGFEVVATPS